VIQVAPGLAIDERDLTEDFIRASGPGGQNVNKLSTAVQLRFDIAGLPEDVRTRLRTLAGRRLTREGVLVITAQRFRTQDRNRQDARERLVALIAAAAERQIKRRKTRPTYGSTQRRLDEKSRRSAIKSGRQGREEG